MITWALFIPACFALNCAPGPNNMLVFSNAARLGLLPALAGGMGRMPAFVILIAVTIVGLGAVLATSAFAFTLVKLAGAAYLIYVGIRFLRHARALATSQSGDVALRALMRRDFFIAIGNPKAIAIFTAFFPQFIDPAMAAQPQLIKMGIVFLLLEVLAVLAYALGGTLLGKALKSARVFVNLNRFVGGALILSGASMAFSRQ
ncbi:LysE family translocator [Nitratireductor basaltis]|uniref:Lysine exporter protein LysE/YggA n=1 Tax=Nitratireductor basaltis TaxID=472175 RepID=A0A084U947_9HYPH|nr:LysE family translocator [Nitratireductor basaltis]KFB09483.1 Lysine exporter protein LysE/YggA [Nitratireductor basaltis]